MFATSSVATDTKASAPKQMCAGAIPIYFFNSFTTLRLFVESVKNNQGNLNKALINLTITQN